jgi:hypothetical protein
MANHPNRSAFWVRLSHARARARSLWDEARKLRRARACRAKIALLESVADCIHSDPLPAAALAQLPCPARVQPLPRRPGA